MSGYERTQAYRSAHPDRVDRERRRNAAYQRALVRLAHIYPDDFAGLYREELAVAGLPRSIDESGHTTPDFVWTLALILLVIVLLRMLGAL